MVHKKKRPCSDCLGCQLCSETRCRQCRKGAHGDRLGDLGPLITHGEYLKWKNRKDKASGDLPEKKRKGQKGRDHQETPIVAPNDNSACGSCPAVVKGEE
jgi:hypothetical protein